MLQLSSYKFKNSGNSWSGIPILKKQNSNRMGYYTNKENKIITLFNKDTVHFPDNLDNNCFMYSSDEDVFKLMNDIYIHKPKFVKIEKIKGQDRKFSDLLLQFKDLYPDITLCAGHVNSPEVVEKYICNLGVDIVQLSKACNECIYTAKLNNGYILCDSLLDEIDFKLID